MAKYKARVAQGTVDSPRLSGQRERCPMTLRRGTEMSGKRKFLVAGTWTSQADSSAEALRPDIVPAITSSRVSRSSLWATHEALRSTAQLIQQLRQLECARRLAATTRSPKRYI
ncbi:uncharacterized protein LOC125028308 [Penaeus chinensis]|uniref:uncharacterized protein LOC125028308 n=1 Tax=Penaeus chinensis TaxID=139456 RepID=UPI001FB61C7F|nr:uncharacterized protein LOC125028308 [Penaeus chinensis]